MKEIQEIKEERSRRNR